MSPFKRTAMLAAACLSVCSLASAATYTFQDGVNSYDGTHDATLYPGGDADVNTGGSTVIYANYGGAVDLLRFDVSSLAGLTVTSASVTMTIADTSVGPENTTYPGPEWIDFTVHAISDANAGWQQGTGNYPDVADPGEASWNYKVNPSTAWAGTTGLSTAGTDYNATAVYTGQYNQLPSYEGQPLVVPLSASLVQYWIDTANAGLRFRVEAHEGYGAIQFYSSDYGATSYRPLLTVEAIPEPASSALVGVVGAGFLVRRRTK